MDRGRGRGGLLALLGGSLLAVLAWSAVDPHEWDTWALEVSPAVVGALLVALTERRFPLSRVALVGIWIHAVILVVGGHYTYARVPLGAWAQDAFDLSRNHYDRLGHVAQGFFPALVAREILLRASPLRRGGWLFFVVTSVCLAISAFYELIEWWVALLVDPAAGESFLATQGDEWDTQWDMLLALLGALSALLLLSRLHDRSMARLGVGVGEGVGVGMGDGGVSSAGGSPG